MTGRYIEQHHVRTFVGKYSLSRTLAGNSHIVYVISQELLNDRKRWLKISKEVDDIVVTLSIFPGFNYVRFYQNGIEIRRCGSGSIAVASVLLKKNNQTQRYHLKSACEQLIVGRLAENEYYYETQTSEYSGAKHKGFWQRVVDTKVERLFFIGGGSDYCAAILDDEFSVKKLKIQTKLMNLLTKRALIVSAPSSRNTEIDYVIRYFAPQYGILEDSATGSANAMIAGYWQKRLGKRTVIGEQLSLEGGRFKVASCLNRQRVAGLVSE